MPPPEDLIPGLETITMVTSSTNQGDNAKPNWKSKIKSIFKKGTKDTKAPLDSDLQKLAAGGALGDASTKNAQEENASVVTGNIEQVATVS